MEEKRHSLITHKSLALWRLVSMGLMFGGIIAGFAGIITYRSISGKASVEVPDPTPFVEIETSNQVDLEMPYVRLSTNKKSYEVESEIPIDLYLNTNGEKTSELRVVIEYDSQYLEFNKADLAVLDIYKAISVEEITEGKIDFLLFITSDVGHNPVNLDRDTKIATLPFRAKGQVDSLEVDFQFESGNNEFTSLSLFSDDRTRSTLNILEEVEGVTFSIE